MLAKRIIPCLDVKDGKVVKGIRFRNHEVMGDIITFAKRYCEEGADELVFYDITASSDGRVVDYRWIARVAEVINIPFCVAGGIRSILQAQQILAAGADKISINSPALENPNLIDELATRFGTQCVVVGIDSYTKENDYFVYQYTGDPKKTLNTYRHTLEWVLEVQKRGAGEIVLNCMNQDGMRVGYDVVQLKKIREKTNIPIIASGGAGTKEHFYQVFMEADIAGALAASIFHANIIKIDELKKYLKKQNILIRI